MYTVCCLGVASVVRTAEGSDDSCGHVYGTMNTVCCMDVASAVRTAEHLRACIWYDVHSVLYGRGISGEVS